MLKRLIEFLIHWRERVLASKAFIDINAKCPCCGHRNGSLHFVRDEKRGGQCRHACKICSAQWDEDTVMKAEGWLAR